MLYYFEGTKLNNGKKIFGFINVSNKEELIWRFQSKKILVKKIGLTKKDFKKRNFIKIKDWEKLAFLKLLNSLIKNCDFSIKESIKILNNRFYSRPLNNKLKVFYQKIKQGVKFSKILKEEGFLKSFYIKIIETGQKTQKIEDYLDIVIDQYQVQNNISKKIKTKILFPLGLIFLFFAINLYWLSALPLYKNLAWAFFALAPALVLLIGFFIFLTGKIDHFKYWRDRLILKLPFIKDLLSDYYELKSIIFLISSFRADLYIPIVFFELAKDTKNEVYKREFLKISDKLKQGNSLNKSLISRNLFCDFFINSIGLGEQVGLNNKAVLDIKTYLRLRFDKKIIFLSNFLKISLIFLVVLFLIVLGTKFFYSMAGGV